MYSRQRKTLKAIFPDPVPTTLDWAKIEGLLLAVGGRVIEGRGSRVRFELKGVVATFHRPDSAKEAKPCQLRDARAFLEAVGLKL
jgi:hypothetical protein